MIFLLAGRRRFGQNAAMLFPPHVISVFAASAALWLGLSSAAWAGELVFGTFELPLTIFTREERKSFPDNGQADAAAALRTRGFDMAEGGCAFYDVASARIFLRSTARDLRRMARMADDNADPEPVPGQPQQVRLSAVCYAIPVSAVPADFGPASPVEALPREKLTVVDRVTLVCRSGQRAWSRIRPPEKEENDADADLEPAASGEKEADDGKAEKRPGQEGGGPEVKYTGTDRRLEIECTISEDSLLLDINMAWEINSPLLAPAGERGFFSVANQVLMRRGRLLTQELGITSEPEPRLVLLALEAAVLKPLPVPQAVPPEPSAPVKPSPGTDK